MSAQPNVRIGSLAVARWEPKYTDRERDIAVYDLKQDELLLLNAKALPLQPRTELEAGTQVTVWGFPGTTKCHMKDAAVCSFEKDYFVLNTPMDPGFSGGPVLDSRHRLVGVVLRSTDKQTRCLRSQELAKIIK